MTTKRIVALVAPLLLVFSAPALGDKHEAPPDIADTWFVEVKGGMDDKFTEALKAHMEYRLKKGDARKYRTYLPVIGDDLNHYVIRYCCTSYEDMDAYTEWGKKAKVGDHWNDNVDQYVASYQHRLQKVDYANSNWPAEEPGFQLYGVTMYQHKMGKVGSIEAAKKALSDAAKAGEWPRYWSFLKDIGGDGRHALVTPFMNYSDMKPPEENFYQFLSRNHGAEKADAMLAAWTDNFDSTTYTVYRYLPDLSMDTMK